MRWVPRGAKSAPTSELSRGRGAGRGAGHLGAEPLEKRGACPVGALRRPGRGGPALLGVSHALERLGLGPEPEEGAEPLLVGGVLQWLRTGEHGDQVGAVHERGEDEVDKAALVAPAAPLVESSGRVLVEGAVAAAEVPVVAGEARELLGHPQLAAGAEVGKHGEPGSERGQDEVAEALLEHVALRPLVVDGVAVGAHERGDRRRPFVGQHHRVAAIEDRGDHGGRGDDGRDGHVPIEETQLVGAAHHRIDLAGDAPDREAGDRRRVLNGSEALAGRLDHAESGARLLGRQRRHRDD